MTHFDGDEPLEQDAVDMVWQTSLRLIIIVLQIRAPQFRHSDLFSSWL